MFIAAVIIPFYLLAVVAMCYMDTAFKAMMFFVLLLIATFILFLFINYPMQSVFAVTSLMAMFAFKPKD
ncbi:membrane protein implicated in regulation of membrane protease activity [Pedobacter sp. AK013]|uniref:hypothetical protein n=1 Tax=Pedobacter sp. AK013 TaxID=2723071 RepID=UPI0016177CDA|nr:hypothetical protein [Pedobacter sp. AK013]MBB6236775.1 membrane protein implicated in regulation of membrane protease activity [Pedobacter sp. AK013]